MSKDNEDNEGFRVVHVLISDVELRMRCLEAAIKTGAGLGNPAQDMVDAAKEFYAFVKAEK